MTTNDPNEPYTPPPATEEPAGVQYFPGRPQYDEGSYGSSYYSGRGYYGQFGPTTYAGTPSGYYQGYPGYPGYAGGAQGTPPQGTPPKKSRHRVVATVGAALVAAALVIAGVTFASGSTSNTLSGSGTALELPQAQQPSSGSSGSTGGSSSGNGGSLPNGGTLPGTLPGGSSSTGGSKTTATATQQVGIVTIVSVLKYQNAESAGTGMILTSDGEILTNNHVVNGATSITVTVESTGKSYRANVVGTAPTKDVAVLKLVDASGLDTAKLADTSQSAKVGDSVIGVGNAGGTGTLTSASGKITALNQSITATDETGQEAEKLSDLIEVNAPIISGDSGGPLYDSAGEVIGIDTAASTNQTTGSASTAYAIRIENALSVADEIDSGVRTTTIHIGLPAFLGITTTQANGGVGVQDVLAGGAASKTGITAGSVITSVGGTAVTTPASLKTVMSTKNPGSKVSVSWTDASGQSHTATATLGTGPAD